MTLLKCDSQNCCAPSRSNPAPFRNRPYCSLPQCFSLCSRFKFECRF